GPGRARRAAADDRADSRGDARRRRRVADRARRGGVPAVIAGAVIDGMGTTRARCVLAPNPSPMTLDGTNTWILAEPGSPRAAVAAPGPAPDGRRPRARGRVAAAGQRVAQLLLPHSPPDHAAGAGPFAALPGAPVRAADPAYRLGEEGLAPGDTISAGCCE